MRRNAFVIPMSRTRRSDPFDDRRPRFPHTARAPTKLATRCSRSMPSEPPLPPALTRSAAILRSSSGCCCCSPSTAPPLSTVSCAAVATAHRSARAERRLTILAGVLCVSLPVTSASSKFHGDGTIGTWTGRDERPRTAPPGPKRACLQFRFSLGFLCPARALVRVMNN